MQPASANVIVLDKRKHLGFVSVAIVRGNVDDLLDVAGERGTRQRRVIMRVVLATNDVVIRKGKGVLPVFRPVVLDGLFNGGV